MSNENSKLTNPWFEHDENASSDGKFLKMFRDFRKLAKTMERSELESFVALGAYAVFWRLAEFMHGNNLHVGDEDIIADDLRIDTNIVARLLLLPKYRVCLSLGNLSKLQLDFEV